MTTTQNVATKQPGVVGRLRSRQAGHPSGLVGRIIGRAMVKDTAAANDRALELLGLLRSSDLRTVLEIGFGQGRTVAKLIEQGHRVLGTEVSRTMVNQATARNRRACRDGRAELLHGDGRSIPFKDAAADVAFMVHTIYFMADPQLTLTEVSRVLRRGGCLVVACRVGDDPMPAWMDPNVYRIPTIGEIKAMFTTAGFETTTHHVGDESTHFTHWFVAKPRTGVKSRFLATSETGHNADVKLPETET